MDTEKIKNSQGFVLIVDDILDNVDFLARSLISRGYRVSVVTSGKAALELIKTDLPALVLLDIWMPEMDGYKVCQKLKSQPQTANIPIIFISALDDITDKVEAFKAGGIDYITKPFHVAEVIARVAVHVQLWHLQHELQEKQQQLIQQNQLLQQEIQNRAAAEAALQIANAELQRLAYLDGLTQVANRLQFDQRIEAEWRRSQRQQEAISLILCDIDFFKYYNDAYGHQAGDECLRQVARAIQGVIKRPGDLVARYGGEEFAVILPDTPNDGAMAVVHEMQNVILLLRIEHQHSQVSPHVSLSFGVATSTPSAELTQARLIHLADQALYQAKIEGRDRIVNVADQPLQLIHQFTESSTAID